ncbi:MAG: hypothetical protein JXQ65_13610 [Candidatus Marinimicrobia bacterium]|nr:hypothetical protein [Candidatus Neomarinimicrobiota bacterium]
MQGLQKEYKKWQRWFDLIWEDVQQQMRFLEIYKDLSVENIQGDRMKFIEECYFVQAAVALRRQFGIQKDEISLMKLLIQIKAEFSKIPQNCRLTEDELNSFIKTVQNIENKLGLYIDRKIVHMDKRPIASDLDRKGMLAALQSLAQIVGALHQFFFHNQ